MAAPTSPIRVTRVRLDRQNEDVLKAFAEVVLNDALVIRGLKVIESSEGHPFVAMPARRQPSGGFEDIAYPLNQSLRETIEAAVLRAYRDGEGGPNSAGVPAPLTPAPVPVSAAAARQRPASRPPRRP